MKRENYAAADSQGPTTMRFLARTATLLFLAISSLPAEEPPADALQAKTQREIEDEKFEQEEAEYVRVNVEKLITAENSQVAGEAFRDLFFSPYTRSAEELSSHENLHVAIQAMWCRYSRTIPRRYAYFGGGDSDLRYVPDLQRFLGFLEGRLRVTVPEWWEKAIEDLHELHRAKEERFPGANWQKFPAFQAAAEGTVVPVTFYPDQEAHRFTVRMPIVTAHKLAGKKVAISGDHRLLIVLMDSFDGGPSELTCIDGESASERWCSRTWGLGDLLFQSGPPITNYASIEIGPDRVVVFGATIQGAYVEAFDLKDGTCVARFATTNWFVRKDDTAATDN